MANYNVTIIDVVGKDTLTAKERISIKDFGNALPIDEATESAPLVIDFAYYVVCSVHNEASDNPDYDKCVIVDKDGHKFITGSQSFINALRNIVMEMSGESEPFSIEVYKKDSKNYKGKKFITCSIV